MQPYTEDRRRHKRYKTENSVSVTPEGVYQVMDISRGGFCFRCPPYTVVSDTWITDILNPIEQLEDYPVSMAWISTPEDNSHGYMPMVVGAKFRKLSKEQNTILSQVIENIPQNGSPPE